VLREEGNDIMRFMTRSLICSAILVATVAVAADPSSRAEKERKLIAVLQSDAPPQDKAIPCKQLAIYGTKEAVPALAALLSNRQLASWARIALEAIPDPAAYEALRKALAQLQGQLLIGVINSISTRRDAKAVGGLTDKLKDSDAQVASAAAEALGHIGGKQAAKALEQSLVSATAEVRSAAAYGCLLCAENFLADGKSSEAIRLYDQLRQADLPKQRIREATRGAILARKSAGIPLLLEQLRSRDKAMLGMALGVARELPGREVTDVLVAELDRASLDRQVLLLQLLADRGDATVLPKVLQLAQSAPHETRTTALGLLDRFGGVSCVPVLVTAAADSDAELAATAQATLARFRETEVDSDLLSRLPNATGKTRQVLIGLAKQRRIAGALPFFAQSTEDADEGVRRAALDAIGVMGEAQEAGELVRLFSKAQNPSERDDIEKALGSICSRTGTKCLPQVLPLTHSTDTALRTVALRTMASIGGTEALEAVKTATQDPDETVQDEAVRTLSNWPNNWPDDAGAADALLNLAKSGKKLSHQVQGLRGYLTYLQEEKKLKTDDKLNRIKELLSSIQRPEEKRLAIATISSLPGSAVGLEPLMNFADDQSVSEEACLAIVKVAAGKDAKNASAELRRKALQTAVEKSKNDATRKQAQDGLAKIR